VVLLHAEDDLRPALELCYDGGATRVQTEILLGHALKICHTEVYVTGKYVTQKSMLQDFYINAKPKGFKGDY
jgi:hypothetical protein